MRRHCKGTPIWIATPDTRVFDLLGTVVDGSTPAVCGTSRGRGFGLARSLRWSSAEVGINDRGIQRASIDLQYHRCGVADRAGSSPAPTARRQNYNRGETPIDYSDRELRPGRSRRAPSAKGKA